MNEKAIQTLIKETTVSYYSYVTNLDTGTGIIVQLFKQNEIEAALHSLSALSEGLVWLLEVEQLLAAHSYRTNSPISEVLPLFQKIKEAMDNQSYTLVSEILEEEFQPLFRKASDWKFELVTS